MFIIVDLPEPDGPITATKSPSAIVRSMPFSASKAAAPWPYVLVTPSISMMGGALIPGSILRCPNSGHDFHARLEFLRCDRRQAAVALAGDHLDRLERPVI